MAFSKFCPCTSNLTASKSCPQEAAAPFLNLSAILQILSAGACDALKILNFGAPSALCENVSADPKFCPREFTTETTQNSTPAYRGRKCNFNTNIFPTQSSYSIRSYPKNFWYHATPQGPPPQIKKSRFLGYRPNFDPQNPGVGVSERRNFFVTKPLYIGVSSPIISNS